MGRFTKENKNRLKELKLEIDTSRRQLGIIAESISQISPKEGNRLKSIIRKIEDYQNT